MTPSLKARQWSARHKKEVAGEPGTDVLAGGGPDRPVAFLGLDVHKHSIWLALAIQGEPDVTDQGRIRNSKSALAKAVGKLQEKYEVRAAYEAGVTGYATYHRLIELEVACIVAAPNLIPSLGRVGRKTDARDAARLARLLREGSLPHVWVPGPEEEGLRSVVRARAQAQDDHVREQVRLRWFMGNLGQECPAGPLADSRRLAAVRRLPLSETLDQIVRDDRVAEIERRSSRVAQLSEAVLRAGRSSHRASIIKALTALRGIDELTAITLVAELGDLRRFPSAKNLMSYVGLVPQERSSGGRRKRGHITKVGSRLARKVLVRAAAAYQFAPKDSKLLRARRSGQPEAVLAICRKAESVLHADHLRLRTKGILGLRRAVAVARKLVGFVWAVYLASAAIEAKQ